MFATTQIDRNDPNRTIYLIPEENLARLTAECAKLSKKCEKLMGWAFEPMIIGRVDRIDGKRTRISYEVYLDVPPVKYEGWTFVARLDHSPDTGNIIRMVPNNGVVLDEKYRTIAPNCDHCCKVRKRRDSFVLQHEDGRFIQVGSNCLQDFLGHDAAKIGRMAEWLGYANEAAVAAQESHEDGGLVNRSYLPLTDFLAYTAAVVRLHGWVSGKSAYENVNLTSTRERALTAMFPAPYDERIVPESQDWDVASAAQAWAQDFANKSDLNDYEHNVLVVANAIAIEFRSAGLAASIVGCYLRHQNMLIERKSFAEVAGASTYLGLEGQKIKMLPARVLLLKTLDTGSILCKFVTRDGQVLSWFNTTGHFPFSQNDEVVLSGTVKKHQEYRGAKDTLMTRCKVQAVQ